MSNSAISQLTAYTPPLADANLFPVVQLGAPSNLASKAPLSALSTYITNAKSALPTTLTGFSAVNSAILATDTILEAFGKAQGQINTLTPSPLTTKGDLYTYSTANDRLPVGSNTQFLVADSTQTTGLKWTGGFLNNATGFSLLGGTVTRSLVLSANCTLDQDLASTASPLWNNASAVNRLRGNAGWLAGVFGSNVTTPVVVMGNLAGVASIGAHNNALSAWTNVYIQPDAIASGTMVGIGLSVNTGGQTANATLHGGGSTILGVATSAVADASIYNSQMNIWYDQSNSRLVFKAKSSGGTVTSFPLTATGGSDQFTKSAVTGGWQYLATDTSINAIGIQNFSGSKSGFFELTSANVMSWVDGSTKTVLNGIKSRVSQTVDVNTASDDFVGLDSTPGANLFNIDVTAIKRPLTIKWVKGVSQPQYKAASGQTIDGSSSTFTMTSLYTAIQFIPNPDLSTDICVTFVRGTIT